jgi:hypothetical protein
MFYLNFFQRNEMKTIRGYVLVAMMAIIGLFSIIGITMLIAYVSAANDGNRTEVALKAKWSDYEGVYAQYGQKVAELAGVTDMAKNDIVDVVKAALSGRYGPDGSKAVFQMIKEVNPSVDPSLYRTIQTEIISGRNELVQNGRQVLDIKRSYETKLGTMPGSFFYRMAGYPMIDLSIYKPISTERASETFKNGKESGTVIPQRRN